MTGRSGRLCFLLVAALSLGVSHAQAGERDADMPLRGASVAVQPDLFTGAATASIPVEVPSGRHGMQPNLALTYWSGGGNGWVGRG